ncbi:MAG TPA: cupredoxin domain-containing protein [bacterium]|nr:cupredoxin domain-containing protein [bacterium]
MRMRWTTASLLAVALLLGGSLVTSAQTPPTRVIKVSMASFKYDPSVITMHVGDRITLQITNDDKDHPGRAHSIGSQFWSTVDYAIAGDAKEGVAKDGWKYILVDEGKTAQVTFVPKAQAQVNFLCEQFNHASLGQVGTFIVWPAGYKP